MMFDLVVLGSGPGGYVAAIRAAQLGMKTAVVEKAEIGGVCLNWGCIPTKALLKSAQVMTDILHAEKFGVQINGAVKPDFSAIIQRSRDIARRMSKGIDYLFKKNNITLIQGFGKITSSNSLKVTYSSDNSTEDIGFKNLIIATGARSKTLPNIPVDGENVLGYRHAMTLPEQPESMLVIGSGAIGTELGFFYNAIGTKVTIVEFLSNVLPLEDEEVSKQMARELKKRKIKLMLSSVVKKVDEIDGQCRVTIDTPKGEVVEVVDKVLLAVGITANIENPGVSAV
jgi:dihydrolipoamide dehydrogenase